MLADGANGETVPFGDILAHKIYPKLAFFLLSTLIFVINYVFFEKASSLGRSCSPHLPSTGPQERIII